MIHVKQLAFGKLCEILSRKELQNLITIYHKVCYMHIMTHTVAEGWGWFRKRLEASEIYVLTLVLQGRMCPSDLCLDLPSHSDILPITDIYM